MRDIPQDVKDINSRLIDHYGIDTSTGQPIWRVVWSDDQFEMRKMDVTDGGINLLFPEVREVPKYRQWIQHKWVLERLVAVPIVNEQDLPATKLSYEPMRAFENAVTSEPLPANFDVACWTIDCLYAAEGKKSLAKYKEDPDATRKRIDSIYEYLSGDESFLIGRTVTGEAVGYTGPSKINPVKES